MAPKRENSPPLPGDDRFGGDYSDERRAKLVRSDGARKRCSRKWTNDHLPVPQPLRYRAVEEFDRLRWERELERRRRARLNGGEGSSSGSASSSTVPPALPPPEEYDAALIGSSVEPEDFVPDEMLESIMAQVKLRSVREAAEQKAQVEQINEILLYHGLEQDRVAAEKKAYWEDDAGNVVDLVSDED